MWQERCDDYASLLEHAESFAGETARGDIMLKRSESLFFTITNTALVEDRRGVGHWEGGSSGVSVPIGSIGRRSVRYRVGSSRGHYVQGTPSPTAIDVGTVFVTNQRGVFQGARQTREYRFDKLAAIQHTPDGSTVFSVSNRQKPTVIHYGVGASEPFKFSLDLALAHYRGDVPTLVTHMKQELAEIDAAKPLAPALPAV